MSGGKELGVIEAQWDAYDRPSDGAAYIHYKGGEYTIVATGFLEESESPCVIYRSKDHDTVWVRTARNFLEEVTHNGERLQRFRKA